MQIDPAKLTRWFQPHEKPAYPGVYKVQLDLFLEKASRDWFSYWNGYCWGMVLATVDDAARSTVQSNWQDKCWCGLKQEPMKGEL